MLANFIINAMQTMPTWFAFCVLFILCMLLIVLFVKFFGKEGLYIYSIVAIITSNIQVLKAVNLEGFEHPVLLGDVVFTSLFLVGDIITECWGKEAAQKSIWLGFASSLMFSIIMFIVVGIKPIQEVDDFDRFFIESHDAMHVLFTPSFSILAASLIAYFLSLWFDVGIFYMMKVSMKDKFLGIRSFVSSSIGIVVDTVVFNIFAWVIFAIGTISIDNVLNNYMINAVKMRLLLAFFSIPVFYLVKRIVHNNKT